MCPVKCTNACRCYLNQFMWQLCSYTLPFVCSNPAYKWMREKKYHIEKQRNYSFARFRMRVCVHVFVCVFELVLFLELRDTLKNVLKLKMLCFKRDFFCSHMRQRIYFIAKWNEPSKHCYCLSLAQWMCITTLNKKKRNNRALCAVI